MNAKEFYNNVNNYVPFLDLELSDLFELMNDFSTHQNKEIEKKLQKECVINLSLSDQLLGLEAENKELIEEAENDHDEIIVLKSQLIVANGWVDYYKEKQLFNKLNIKETGKPSDFRPAKG